MESPNHKLATDCIFFNVLVHFSIPKTSKTDEICKQF